MKLLFDQNLSPKLVLILSDTYPGSNHVFNLGLDAASDVAVREYAGANDFVIVTKDADFPEMFSLLGGPPRIIWIRRGNCPTKEIAAILREHFDHVLGLIESKSAGVLTLY